MQIYIAIYNKIEYTYIANIIFPFLALGEGYLIVPSYGVGCGGGVRNQ